jgi:hypothetical protein
MTMWWHFVVINEAFYLSFSLLLGKSYSFVLSNVLVTNDSTRESALEYSYSLVFTGTTTSLYIFKQNTIVLNMQPSKRVIVLWGKSIYSSFCPTICY